MKGVWLLILIMRRHHAFVERRIGDLGIHHGQHRMLMYLAKRGENMPSQRDLAEVMGVSPAAVTTILKKMEKEGYVSRTVTDEDNRRHEIRITEAGLAKITESRAVFEATDRAMFAGFTPEEMAAFTAFVERLNVNLDALDAPADPPPTPHDRIPTLPTERK
jgi:DNA-binding MarR family transcriptional regulator